MMVRMVVVEGRDAWLWKVVAVWRCRAGKVRAAGTTANGRRAARRSMTRPAPCPPALAARSASLCVGRHSALRDNLSPTTTISWSQIIQWLCLLTPKQKSLGNFLWKKKLWLSDEMCFKSTFVAVATLRWND